MKKLALAVASGAVLFFYACSFHVSIEGGKYFPCRPDGTCPQGCFCLAGQVCVPERGAQPEDACRWCPPGYGDCDGLVENGCETELRENAENCGECGKSCGDNANCIQANCVCNQGWENCDNDWSNGCETDITKDVQNCGGCSNHCSGVERLCSSSGDVVIKKPVCKNSSCEQKEDVVACESACNLGSCYCDSGYCWGGPCGETVCRANEFCKNGVCVCGTFIDYETCGSSRICCSGTCRPIDRYNCEGCDRTCLQNEYCDIDGGFFGVCRPCSSGFADCDGNGTNGCEENIVTSASNCGGCGIACSESVCCNKVCTNVLTDRDNCGLCKNGCVGEKPCTNGRCGNPGVECFSGMGDEVITCPAGLVCCANTNNYPTCQRSDSADCLEMSWQIGCDDSVDCPVGFFCCVTFSGAANNRITTCAASCEPLQRLCGSDADCGGLKCCKENVYNGTQQSYNIWRCRETCN